MMIRQRNTTVHFNTNDTNGLELCSLKLLHKREFDVREVLMIRLRRTKKKQIKNR